MILTTGFRYSCNVRLSLLQSVASNDQVKDHLQKDMPLFDEIEVEGSGKIRRVTAKYTGETKDIELDSRISNIKILEVSK